MEIELQQALAARNYELADGLIDRWLEKEPSNGQAIRLKAISQWRHGDVGAAQARLQALMQRDPHDAMAQLLLAQILLPSDPASAHRYFESAAANDPNLGMAHVGRADFDLRRGDFARAEELFHTALRADPELLPAQVGLVHCRMAQGDFDQAEQIAVKTASAHPQEPLALLTLGRVFLARERYTFAEQSLRRALQLEASAAGWQLLGRTLFAAGKLSEAQQIAERLLGANGRDAQALELRGDIEDEARRTRRALRYYEQAVVAAPGDRRLFQKMIDYCFNTGRESLGMERLQAAARANPRAPTLWAAWINALSARGDVQALDALFQEWLARAPDLAAARALAIQSYQSLGNLAAVRIHAQALKAQLPGQPSAAMALASLALAERDGVTALAELDAIAQIPDHPEVQHRIHILRGRAHDMGANRVAAMQHFRKASALVKNDVLPRVPVPAIDPPTVPAHDSTDGAGLIFLIGLPAGGVATVQSLLERQPGILSLKDRHYQPGLRKDLVATAAVPTLDAAGLRAAATAYAQEYQQFRIEGRPRWTVDWLLSLDLATYVTLSAALPQAHWLIVQRDPKDCLLQLLAVGAGGMRDEVAAAKRLRAQAEVFAAIAARGDAHTHVLNFDLVLKHGEPELVRALGTLGIKDIDTSAWSMLVKETAAFEMYLPSAHWVAYKAELASPLKMLA